MPAIPNLVALFNLLETPKKQIGNGNYLAAITIQDFDTHRLGKNYQGQPLVLLSSVNVEKTPPPPIELEHLSVIHNAECRIIRSDETIEFGYYSVVHCVSDNRDLQEYFLDIISTIIVVLGRMPSTLDILQAINTLIELFRATTRPPKKTVQGLWAEIYFIERSTKPTDLIEAWHIHPDDVYDFSFGNQRIEIKSSSKRTRQHHFSLEQLRPKEGIDVLIVSMFVERTETGKSINELLASIYLHLTDRHDIKLHLDEIVGLTLGNKWKEAKNDPFNDALAESSLLLYKAKDIPSVNPDLPLGVSNVHFQVDFSKSKGLSKDQYRNTGGIFGSI